MEPLEVSTYSLFTSRAAAVSPRVDEPGIRLAARDLTFGGGVLSVELLLAWRFDPAFAVRFERPADAIVVSLEDAEAGRAAACSTIDPRKRFPERPGPNYLGPRPLAPDAILRTGGWVNLPLRIPLAPTSLPGPSFYATAFLHRHVSNTLAFDLAAPSVASFLDGEPHDPPHGEEPALEPSDVDEVSILGPAVAAPIPPARPRGPAALTLAPRKPGAYRVGERIELEAVLALPPDELDALGPAGWLRSVFVWASPESAPPGATVGHWLGSRIVFADQFTVRPVGGQPRAVATLRFELERATGLGTTPGRYHVHVSARHHRSAVLEAVVA